MAELEATIDDLTKKHSQALDLTKKEIEKDVRQHYEQKIDELKQQMRDTRERSEASSSLPPFPLSSLPLPAFPLHVQRWQTLFGKWFSIDTATSLTRLQVLRRFLCIQKRLARNWGVLGHPELFTDYAGFSFLVCGILCRMASALSSWRRDDVYLTVFSETPQFWSPDTVCGKA